MLINEAKKMMVVRTPKKEDQADGLTVLSH
jgi:hypothetical protein